MVKASQPYGCFPGLKRHGWSIIMQVAILDEGKACIPFDGIDL